METTNRKDALAWLALLTTAVTILVSGSVMVHEQNESQRLQGLPASHVA